MATGANWGPMSTFAATRAFNPQHATAAAHVICCAMSTKIFPYNKKHRMFSLAKQLVKARQAVAAADAELERAYKELAYIEMTDIPERAIAAAMDSIKNDQIYDNASGKYEEQLRSFSGPCGCDNCHRRNMFYESIFSGKHYCSRCALDSTDVFVCPPEVSELLKLETKQWPAHETMDYEWRTLGPDVDAICRMCSSPAQHHFRGSACVLCDHHFQSLPSVICPPALAQE